MVHLGETKKIGKFVSLPNYVAFEEMKNIHEHINSLNLALFIDCNKSQLYQIY